MFRSGSGSVVVGCGYNSCDSLQSSDHRYTGYCTCNLIHFSLILTNRPVYALFHVELKPLEEIDGYDSPYIGYKV